MKRHDRRMLWARIACLATACGAAAASAGTLNVEVTDRDGDPVNEVVVYAMPVGSPTPTRLPEKPLVMSQNHERFSPHILVAQTGSSVSFPNEDTVSHHVYSFSKPKVFELPLYKGTAYPPVVFDHPGVVDIGCNIHDHMEAHIVVVDTPYFALSGDDGVARLENLPAGEYSVEVYTPRLRASALPQATPIELGSSPDMVLSIRFEDRLRPPHATESGSLSWSHY